MAYSGDSRRLEKFHAVLGAEGFLRGSDDLLKRLPSFSARWLTNCGAEIEGFSYDGEIKEEGFDRFGIREGECPARMGLRGFYFFWGKKENDTFVTRISPISGNSGILPGSVDALDYLLMNFWDKYKKDKQGNSKFSLGEAAVSSDGDINIFTRPAALGDKIRGSFIPWWDSYSYGVMKPAVGIINHYLKYHKIDHAMLLEDFSVLFAPK